MNVKIGHGYGIICGAVGKEPTIVITDGLVRISSEDEGILRQYGKVTRYNDTPEQEEGHGRIREAHIIVADWYRMLTPEIQISSHLGLICIAGTGYDGHVDLPTARERRIVVCNAPEYGTTAVAEFAVGLMLNAARWLGEADRATRQGEWKPKKLKGQELTGKTLGIIGFGRIGKRLADICRMGFDMKIRSVRSTSPREEFESLLRDSDVISIHTPLTDTTQGMLGKNEFALMKPGTVLVNTARANLIDPDALLEAVSSQRIAVGLDVLPEEPLSTTHPLLRYPNVIVSQHIASHTEEAYEKLSHTIIENVKAYLNGSPVNVVS